MPEIRTTSIPMEKDKTTTNQGLDLQFIAGQLRKPNGDFAPKVAEKMNTVNEPLYHLTLKTLQLADNESVLEIGFGSGKFFDKLFLEANNLDVSGIDYSKEMVEMATQINSAQVATGHLKLDNGSSDSLPYADQRFDKVFCNMVIYFWEQPENHLKEIRRVLKQNGKFYIGFRPRKSMLQLPFTQYDFTLYDPDDWSAILRQNGFSIAGLEQSTDPAIEDNGNKMQLESICIVAGKV